MLPCFGASQLYKHLSNPGLHQKVVDFLEVRWLAVALTMFFMR